MPEILQVDHYSYYLYSSRSESDANAVILLYGGGKYLGAIFFSNDTDSPLKPAKKSAAGVIGLYYYMSDLPAIIDMLRHEKPVYLVYDGEKSRISTSAEPVGEGDER